MRKYISIVLLLVLSLAAGCSQLAPAVQPTASALPAASTATPPALSVTGTPPQELPIMPTPTMNDKTPASGPSDLVESARSFLAQTLGVPVEGVELLSYEAVDWPDTSIGCPKPGLEYMQVITPGYRLVLQVEQAQYQVHTGSRTGSMILCRPETIPSEVKGQPSSAIKLPERAAEDLASRLGVQPGDVRIVSVTADEFPAGDLGCPQPGVTPLPMPAIVTGQVILLEVDGVQYRYHAHGPQLVYCGQVDS